RPGDDLVHAVEGADERRLAASRRPDERRHRPGFDREGDAFDGAEVAVVDVEVADFDALGHGVPPVQRPVFGAKARAMIRATRLRSMTRMMRVSAPAQARSTDAAAFAPWLT